MIKIKTIYVNNCAYKCVCSVLHIVVLCVVFCVCVCAYCVHIVCICIVEVLHICVFCILCRCMIVVHGMQIYVCVIAYVYVRMCVWYSVEVVFNPNPIPPYMVTYAGIG